MKVFWVEDFLSGEVIDNKYYSIREEAAARRNELGYGIVKEFKSQKAVRNGPTFCITQIVGPEE